MALDDTIQPASSGSRAANLTSVSASSAIGSESRTMPVPAEQRGAPQNSPSPVASAQPTGPAYQPRSSPSSAGMSGAAPSSGSPPTAGVGCIIPARSRSSLA